MAGETLIDGMFWFVAFLLSTTIHEAAHAWVALLGGDPTARGQVTLSPIPHIRREPIGMLVVPLLTAFTQGWAIGWASTPYDPQWAAQHPHRAARMAAAGPAANLLIALVAFLALRIGLATGVFAAPAAIRFEHLVDPVGGGTLLAFAAQGLSVLLILNVLLMAFNLIPLPPLDGASVIGLLLPADAARGLARFIRTPAFSFLGLVVAWRVFPRLARPLFRAVLTLLHPGSRYG
jgi:Zn-dependent protease